MEKGCDKMTYYQIDVIACQVAARLSKIITKREVVCVYSNRSFLWLCAIFGILKAGGVYCSMDPSEPQDFRNRKFILSGARTFIVSKSC